MFYKRVIVIIGLVLILFPLLGFPSWFENFILVLFGIILILFSFVFQKQLIKKEKEEERKVKPLKVENKESNSDSSGEEDIIDIKKQVEETKKDREEIVDNEDREKLIEEKEIEIVKKIEIKNDENEEDTK